MGIWGHDPYFLINVALTSLIAGIFWTTGCILADKVLKR